MNMTMDNFDEVIFDDDEFLENEVNSENLNPPEVQEQPASLEPASEEDLDLTSEVLRYKGITDPSKIKFEDESGAIIERPWDSLSKDEQINILVGSETSENNDLDDEEITLLNEIRTSGLTPALYINQLQATNKPQQVSNTQYKIEDLSDEDVYALDLLEKVGSENISDEEITQAIEAAKQNEALFKKTVEGLRTEYERLQKDLEVKEANDLALAQQEAYNRFATSIMSEIRGLDSFAGKDLQLSKEDVDNLQSFILDLDDLGTSAFGKALQDPKLFTKAAFWLLNENEIVEELTKLMLDNFKRGYQAGLADLKNKAKVVFAPKPPVKSNDDVFADDDDWV